MISVIGIFRDSRDTWCALREEKTRAACRGNVRGLGHGGTVSVGADTFWLAFSRYGLGMECLQRLEMYFTKIEEQQSESFISTMWAKCTHDRYPQELRKIHITRTATFFPNCGYDFI